MSFPLIRPEQAAAMTAGERTAYLRWLRHEIQAAADRHGRILTERAARRMAEQVEEERAVEALTGGWTAQERADADRMLGANRTLIDFGQRHGDGTPDDDLRAAHTAVTRGSTNGYLLALNREYQRRQWARARQARVAMTTTRRAS